MLGKKCSPGLSEQSHYAGVGEMKVFFFFFRADDVHRNRSGLLQNDLTKGFQGGSLHLLSLWSKTLAHFCISSAIVP